MPDLPNLTAEQVIGVIPRLRDVALVGRGGQKLVFRAELDGEVYAIKFALVPEEIEVEEISDAEVTARAAREVETMRDCTSRHMVKIGPIGLTFSEIAGQKVLFFSEEFVDGRDLKQLLRGGEPLTAAEVVTLGLHITDAIRALWDIGKIHRDIKPGNIMRRAQSSAYVLLDAGLAFDVVGESLSGGLLVGTPIYFSPEQFDYSSRRTGMDFRSDIFALGVTMYEMLTGRHPFWEPGVTSQTLYGRIRSAIPRPPSELALGVPPQLDDVILRMLGKSPHLRYRKCDQLISALERI